MGNLVDVAGAILSQAGQRLEISAVNLSNASTPGFRRGVTFAQAMDAAGAPGMMGVWTDFSHGKQITTNNPYDLAISSDGFFCVSAPDGLLYTRAGQLQRDADGRLVTAQGWTLQAEGGGDITVKSSDFQVQADGTVVEGGAPVAKIAVQTLPQGAASISAVGGYFAAPEDQVTPVETPSVRQGAFETSNVSTGDEMVRMMESLRQAETGQRLVGVYDDLMGRVLSILGESA
jgi:flagellar basal-body rod protein FlgG